MQPILRLAGSITGIAGIALCLIAGLARVSGEYYLLGYETTTLFTVGTGLMVFACLAKLECLLAKLAD